jgi:outer membrane biosynthesis protein TonB
MKACAWVNWVAGIALSAAIAFPACGGSDKHAEHPSSSSGDGDETGMPDEESGGSDTAAEGASPSESSEDDSSGEKQAQPTSERSGEDLRTTDKIANIVKIHRDEARACYDKARKDHPEMKAGNLVIHFVLDPHGEVSEADVNKDRSTLTEPGLVDCVVGVIKKIKFPPSSRGMETKVNYPFNFNPR